MKFFSFDGFEETIGALAKTANDNYGKAARAIGIEWFSGVIMRTPRDEGRLAGNWLTSAGAPNYSQVARTDHNAAIAEVKENFDPFSTMYMTNNLPYAERREKEGGQPVKNGKGVGGNFVFEELERVIGNANRIIGGG